jgi:hypothetical protein
MRENLETILGPVTPSCDGAFVPSGDGTTAYEPGWELDPECLQYIAVPKIPAVPVSIHKRNVTGKI